MRSVSNFFWNDQCELVFQKIFTKTNRFTSLGNKSPRNCFLYRFYEKSAHTDGFKKSCWPISLRLKHVKSLVSARSCCCLCVTRLLQRVVMLVVTSCCRRCSCIRMRIGRLIHGGGSMKGDPWKVQDQYQASGIRDQQATQHSNSDKTQPYCHKGSRNTLIYFRTLDCNWIPP